MDVQDIQRKYKEEIESLRHPVYGLRDARLPDWKESLVRPVFEEVIQRITFVKWDELPDKLFAAGLRAACRLWGKDSKGKTVLITITPGDIKEGELYFDTGKVTNEYKPGTIGYMNGGNNISLPLESIDQLFALVRKQQFENLSLKEQVLETVEARRQGDWDHPGLLEFGCLDTGDEVDVLKIIEQSTLSDEDRLFVMKECGLAKN